MKVGSGDGRDRERSETRDQTTGSTPKTGGWQRLGKLRDQELKAGSTTMAGQQILENL